ncbi:MAG: COX15/CtaA family protein [Chloroflexota bacterium]|nr:COX15/CtaA family protein [Chloroflexota bacterium]
MVSTKGNKAVTTWLFIVCGLIIFMVAFGGLVRLTHSGLSIVEWNVISGVLPPIGEQAWQAEFAKYQQTPEFQLVNREMMLDGFKGIFYLEWFHRLVARLAGLFVVIPLLYFLIKGIIPWRDSLAYMLIALVFAFQGFLGWYMVSSGLVDRPAVSHYRLTVHLLVALGLLALTLWTALNRVYGTPKLEKEVTRSASFWLAVLTTVILVIQIAYGGLMAGLKAGYVSNTFPLMFGYLIPPGLLSVVEPWWRNLIELAATVHFTHRWFAFVVLIFAVILTIVTGRRGASQTITKSLLLLIVLACFQIVLGVSVIWMHVPIVLALLHQSTAMAMFVVLIFVDQRILGEGVGQASQVSSEGPLPGSKSTIAP